MRGNNYVGAFIGGANSVSIVNCSNAAEVEGASCVGGIEGSNGGTRGYTSGCSNVGVVVGSTNVGGIVGNGNPSLAIAPTSEPLRPLRRRQGRRHHGTSEAASNYTTSCYNAGPVSAVTAGAITASSGYMFSNCLYDKDASTPAGKPAVIGVGEYSETPGKIDGVSSADLKSWGAAYQLNRMSSTPNAGSGLDYASVENAADMTTWRQATGVDATLENKGYPVLVALDATDADGNAAASLQAAADWSDVGGWVDAFIMTDEKIDQRVPGATPGELLNYKPDTSVNDGSTDAKAIELSTPEALAWWVYKSSGWSAIITADIDLFGTPYTGVDANLVVSTDWGAPSNIEDGLLWTGTANTGASLNGGGNTVKHMHATNGLLEGAQEMRDLILAEGLVDASGQASAYAGAFASTSATAGSVEFWNLVNQSVAVRGSGDAGSVASGIVGLNGRTSVFVGCANRAPVSAASIVGGIVGINPSDSATFYLCANEGSISAAPGLNPSMANGIAMPIMQLRKHATTLVL